MLTYIDSSVLINAIVGKDAARKMRCLSIFGDQRRVFVATRYLTLEVLPVPTKYNLQRELHFYQRFFSNVTHWIDETPLLQPAITLACQCGLTGLDALHLVAAQSLNAEFVSAERPTKPMYAAYHNTLSVH